MSEEKKRPLKIGLLIDELEIPSWKYEMVKVIQASDFAEISLVILGDNQRGRVKKSLHKKILGKLLRPRILAHFLLDKIYSKFVERVFYLPDCREFKSWKTLLTNVPILKVTPICKKWSDWFTDQDIEAIKKYNLDLMIRGGFRILRGKILTICPCGLWSYHHGDNTVNRGGPPAFWESMESWKETGTILQILTEDLDNGKVLARTFSCTEKFTLKDNLSKTAWKSLMLVPRELKKLYLIGSDNYFSEINIINQHPVFYSEKLYKLPNLSQKFSLVVNKVFEKIKIIIRNNLFLDQWILLFELEKTFPRSLYRYKKIIPPKDRFWADPFVIYKDGKYFIFIEELLFSTNKGHISLIEMDEKGKYTYPKPILERDYHLSYPFVFYHEENYYMVPETIQNKTVELFKCTSFPDKWEFKMNLMENIQAVDATLHFYENKWWLFANVVEVKGASDWDELHLFYSDDLFSSKWTPHKDNPVVSDVKNSRPAGKLFYHNGNLYRPSQNSSHHYGYGFNINHVISLSTDRYEEVVVSKIKPNWDKNIVSTHTYNNDNRLHVIDAQLKVSRFGK